MSYTLYKSLALIVPAGWIAAQQAIDPGPTAWEEVLRDSPGIFGICFVTWLFVRYLERKDKRSD